MEETIEYIESYFGDTLSEAEKKAFENRCETDNAFAETVAWYISARQALREELLQQKQQQWQQQAELKSIAPVKTFSIKRIVPFAAAASLLIAAVIYFLMQASSPQQLAGKYVSEHYNKLSLYMNASQDTMQQAIELYNAEKYDAAALMFSAYGAAHKENDAAKRNAGLAFMQLKNYDAAISEFESLAAMTGLFSNPGKFLQATALLQRNHDGDKAKAKELLMQVVNENLDGKEEAENWLKKL